MSQKRLSTDYQETMRNKYNNMGGIIQVELLFTDEIRLFSTANLTAIIKLDSNKSWRILPIIPMGVSPTINQETNESGTNYKHSLVIRLKRSSVSTSKLHLLRTINSRGCVIKCQDTNGNIRVYGTKEHPLFGSISEKQGTTAADYSGYELNLSGTSIYPQLPYSEL